MSKPLPEIVTVVPGIVLLSAGMTTSFRIGATGSAFCSFSSSHPAVASAKNEKRSIKFNFLMDVWVFRFVYLILDWSELCDPNIVDFPAIRNGILRAEPSY